MSHLSVTNNPSNWLGPIWLVANYGIPRTLNYGYRMEAEIMYKRTMRLLGEDLEKTGCLHEYYNHLMENDEQLLEYTGIDMADDWKKKRQ